MKLLLNASFFAIFFCCCFAKVFLCQRVNKNYCSFNTKLKCFCILVFSKKKKVITVITKVFFLGGRVISKFFFFGQKKRASTTLISMLFWYMEAFAKTTLGFFVVSRQKRKELFLLPKRLRNSFLPKKLPVRKENNKKI